MFLVRGDSIIQGPKTKQHLTEKIEFRKQIENETLNTNYYGRFSKIRRFGRNANSLSLVYRTALRDKPPSDQMGLSVFEIDREVECHSRLITKERWLAIITIELASLT